MKDEVASVELQRLLGINKSVLGELAQKGIVKRGSKRGTYLLQESVSGYCASGNPSGNPRGNLGWKGR